MSEENAYQTLLDLVAHTLKQHPCLAHHVESIAREVLSNKSELNLWNRTPPYDYVQNIFEYNVHDYLGIKNTELLKWCIVGGHLGNEIPRILANYPNVKVTVFECSQRYADNLHHTFRITKMLLL